MGQIISIRTKRKVAPSEFRNGGKAFLEADVRAIMKVKCEECPCRAEIANTAASKYQLLESYLAFRDA
jgi:hypothetical protein